jgi:hypothetical protein
MIKKELTPDEKSKVKYILAKNKIRVKDMELDSDYIIANFSSLITAKIQDQVNQGKIHNKEDVKKELKQYLGLNETEFSMDDVVEGTGAIKSAIHTNLKLHKDLAFSPQANKDLHKISTSGNIPGVDMGLILAAIKALAPLVFYYVVLSIIWKVLRSLTALFTGASRRY